MGIPTLRCSIIKHVFCAGILLFFSVSAFSVQEVVYRRIDSKTDEMIVSFLKLVVSKSNADIKLVSSAESYTDDRAIAELESGAISVYWTMTSKENEKRMLAIRYPVDKGLLGYRVFLIRQGDQARFDSINSLADLKAFKAGQGSTWPDTAILRHAGIPVVTTTKYVNLFPMLDGARFDFFPRGIHEPWAEIVTWSKFPLTVEKNIILKYPTALYFFVSKNNIALAKIIDQGFERAIADGSYDQMFYTAEPIRELVKNSNLRARKIINIENPLLPSDTPVNRQELWFDPMNSQLSY